MDPKLRKRLVSHAAAVAARFRGLSAEHVLCVYEAMQAAVVADGVCQNLGETGAETLERARCTLASAYQAAGVLVHPEVDQVPSDEDLTGLLDLLSRWEEFPRDRIESFLPWPKQWVPAPACANDTSG